MVTLIKIQTSISKTNVLDLHDKNHLNNNYKCEFVRVYLFDLYS